MTPERQTELDRRTNPMAPAPAAALGQAEPRRRSVPCRRRDYPPTSEVRKKLLDGDERPAERGGDGGSIGAGVVGDALQLERVG